MKNTANMNSYKPLWLNKMNRIALIVALLLIVSAVVFTASVFSGFSGFFILDIFIAMALPFISIIFLFAFPPTMIGVVYEIVTICLNVHYTNKAMRERFYYNKFNANRKYCGFGNDSYYM